MLCEPLLDPAHAFKDDKLSSQLVFSHQHETPGARPEKIHHHTSPKSKIRKDLCLVAPPTLWTETLCPVAPPTCWMLLLCLLVGYREGKFTAAVDSIPTALKASKRKKPEGKGGGERKQKRTEGKTPTKPSPWFLCSSPSPLLSYPTQL